ncbi:Argininosuccinate synthase [Metarhizium brunneum]
MADVGQEANFGDVEKKALSLGAERLVVADLQQEFVDEFIFPAIHGRQDLLNFAAQNKIPVSSTPKAPWSKDDNLAHCSYDAGILEQPELTPLENMWTRTVDPMKAPDEPAKFTIHFEKGIPVKVEIGDKVVTGSLEISKALNEIGRVHGVGRIDIVESRFIGLKSRGCYDTPGLTIARLAHIDLEGLVMDSKVRSLRDRFVTYEWSQCLYNVRSGSFSNTPWSSARGCSLFAFSATDRLYVAYYIIKRVA